jgi:hypothetical protein
MDEPAFETNIVIEQSQLNGSSRDYLLPRVATVYIDGQEYRVLAPPKAVGAALDWTGQFSVRRPNPEQFHSEIIVEGVYRILVLKLVREELERMKYPTKKAAEESRQENRKSRLRELLKDLSNFHACGPSDDPDEQTSVVESYRYLLINVKTLSKGILPTTLCNALDAVPSKIESIYDVSESKAHLDAVCVDIRSELENPSTIVTASTPVPAPTGDLLEKWHLTRMADEVPTLKALKGISISKQAQLLLRRLATQYPRSDMTFGKMNFALHVYAADLASGYELNEITAVKDLLLGAPWKKLEAEGFIADNGQGFFHVTIEGYEAAKQAEAVFQNREILDALKLLHPEFQNYGHYFYENKLAEAIAAAFERYENRLNEIRDGSKNAQVMMSSGHPLVYRLFATKILKEPYPSLGSNPTTKEAYQQGLSGLLSSGVSWFRNARTHEKHNLPSPSSQEALELLFVASYLMRMLDLSQY